MKKILSCDCYKVRALPELVDFYLDMQKCVEDSYEKYAVAVTDDGDSVYVKDGLTAWDYCNAGRYQDCYRLIEQLGEKRFAYALQYRYKRAGGEAKWLTKAHFAEIEPLRKLGKKLFASRLIEWRVVGC